MEKLTIFCDLDGCLIPHLRPLAEQHVNNDFPKEALPGVVYKLMEWERAGHRLVLTTGRRECWREFTEKQLRELGIWYDQLIMGLGTNKRVLINDLKPGSEEPMAVAINLPRNQGVGELKL
jgi:hypothetical protein